MDIDILEILKSRRSHFRKEFTGERVSDDIIKYLLDCAHQAPTHKLTFPWFFKVFSENSLQKLCDEILKIHLNSFPQSNEIEDTRIQKIKQIPSEVSHIIAVCMIRDKERRVPEIEEICAVACAVENIYIGLLNFPNIGGYWCTGNGASTEQMHHYLNLSKEDKCLGFFMIGKINNRRTRSNRPLVDSYTEWI
ncbi:MAG: nitroreductase [Bacteroidetes bacterium]|nr:nitroreductase [Bacteroidota bacterium]